MKRTFWMWLVLLLAAPAAFSAGKDGLWELTTKMEIEGMPEMPKGFAIPGMPGGMQKQTICLAEGQQYESKEQKECKVIEQKQSGKKQTVKIKCKEGTMTVENEQLSKDHWRSKVIMTGEHAGTINTEGKRIGTCDASKEGGMSRETQKVVGDMEAQSGRNAAEIGKECLKAVAEWPSNFGIFDHFDTLAKQRKDAIAREKGQNMKLINATHPEVPNCAKAKVDFCAKSKAAGKEMATRKGYLAAIAKHGTKLAPGLSYCGVQTTALLAGHCKSAMTETDYGFVASHCPAERKALAAKHCAGRSYSSVEPKYQPLCGRDSDGGRDYSSQGGSEPGAMDRVKGLFGGGSSGGGKSGAGRPDGGRSESAPAGDAAGASGKDAGNPAVDEGVKQLKKMFGF